MEVRVRVRVPYRLGRQSNERKRDRKIQGKEDQKNSLTWKRVSSAIHRCRKRTYKMINVRPSNWSMSDSINGD